MMRYQSSAVRSFVIRAHPLATLLLVWLLVSCGTAGTSPTSGGATATATSVSAATTATATPVASPTRSGSPAGSPTATSTVTAGAAGSPTAQRPTGAPGSPTPSRPSVSGGGTGSNAAGGNGNSSPRNEVRVENRTDRRLMVRGNVQLNQIPGDVAEPVNLAYATSSCTDCQTIAVALQINLIGKTATRIAPQNVAVALNVECTRCVTVARAIQYTYQVDDPKEEPEDVKDLIREMDRTLNELAAGDKQLTLAEAETRINAVIGQFRLLAASLDDRRNEDDRDTGKGSPTPQGAVTPSVTPATTPTSPPSPTPTNSPTPTSIKPTFTPVPSPSPTRVQ